MRKNHRLEHLRSQAAELENYESVISNLDQEVEEVQNEIKMLKERQQLNETKSKKLKYRNSNSEKLLKYTKVQQKVLEDQVTLAKRYTSSRAVIAANFTRPENVAQLFASEKSSPLETIGAEAPRQFELDPSKRQFSAPIRNTMMSLSHSLISSCLVELNLHSALNNKSVLEAFPLKMISRPNLLASMKLDDEKKEMLRHLSYLRENSKMPSKSLKDILSAQKVADLMLDSRHSEKFESTEQRRYDMYIHKSGRWQNYDDSDTHNHILGVQGPVFRSNIINNREYIKKFDKLFNSYRSNTKKKLKHINLALGISKILGTGGDYIPSSVIFRELMDRFGQVDLASFQSLVYDHLPQFSDRRSAWADDVLDHGFAEKDGSHFRSSIEEDPRLLGSLFHYHRGNHKLVRSLLRYLEPVNTGAISGQDVLPTFMTQMPNSQSATPHSNSSSTAPILFTKGVLEQAIHACFHTKEYKSIDRLLTKLVFNSIETPGGLRVYSSGNYASEELVLNKYTSEEADMKLFNEEILCTLGRAYVEQNDQRRCEWLAPLIKKFLQKKETNRLGRVYEMVLQVLNTPRIVEHKSSRSPNASTQNTSKSKFYENEPTHSIETAVT